MAKKLSQNIRILNALSQGKKLSMAQALKQFGTKRLAARIYDLRHEYHIEGIVTGKNKSGKTAYYIGAPEAV